MFAVAFVSFCVRQLCRERSSACAVVTAVAGVLLPVLVDAQSSSSGTGTHPLLPGIRSNEVNNPEWPRTLHDAQLTGFSPLTCGMTQAPKMWSSVRFGGKLNWLKVVRDSRGDDLCLVRDNQLRLISAAGRTLWRSTVSGSLVYFGRLGELHDDALLLAAGPTLSLLSAATGELLWQHRFEPTYAGLRVDVADVLTASPGPEAVVFVHNGDKGYLLHFPASGAAQFVWSETVVVPGEWQERYDHGSDVIIDTSEPDRPLVWNVRHHRCRGFDARTGEMLSTAVYKIDGAQRRNYGAWAVGRSVDGARILGLIASGVELHAHGLRLHAGRDNELAWWNYYGYVFDVHGVYISPVVIDDLSGDGGLDIVYSVRDPARDYRSFVRVRDAATGEVTAELEDQWCLGATFHPRAARPWVLHVADAPQGATPERGDLQAVRLEGEEWKTLAEFPAATPWRPLVTASGGAFRRPDRERELFLLQSDPDGVRVLRRYSFRGERAFLRAETRAETLTRRRLLDVMYVRRRGRPELVLLTSEGGRLEAWDWSGAKTWSVNLSGGHQPRLSAVDFDQDGRAELVATTSGDRVKVFGFTAAGEARERLDLEFRGADARHRLSPLVYDLAPDAKRCLIAPGSTERGFLAVRAHRADGSQLWESELTTSTGEGGTVVAWSAGDFLPGRETAIAVSVSKRRYLEESTYCLDGRTGEILWHKTLYGTGVTARPYRSHAIPAAFDVDGDGIDEIGMDLYSYMAWLSGVDGSFDVVRHTRNIQVEGALAVGHLQNSFVPVFRAPQSAEPHWFVPMGSHGPVGVMSPSTSEALWVEEFGYDVPAKVGVVDIDGDGILEVGYAAQRSTRFRCRDFWSGEVEWELDLPQPVSGPVLAADVDGDGRGEFLIDRFCVASDGEGSGAVMWEAPVSLSWAIIADFDGDGRGEIACPGAGAVYILDQNE